MSGSRTERRGQVRAVALLFGCALLWSLNGPLIKQLSGPDHGQTGVSIAVWRSVFAGLALLPFCTRTRPGWRPGVWWVVACASFAAMCALFVCATTLTAAGNAIILQYTAPMWIFLLSPLVLGERPSPRDWATLPVVLAGVVTICGGQLTRDALGIGLALGSGVAFAFVLMSFRRLRDAHPIALPCLLNLTTAVLLAPLLAAFPSGPRHASTWALLAFMGIVQMGMPYLLLAHAVRSVSAARAALIALCEPVMNPLWTYLWIGERLPPATAAGGALILAALAVRTWLDLRPAPSAAGRT